MHRRKFLSVTSCALLSPVAGCINPEIAQIGERIDTSVSNLSVQTFRIQQSVAYSGVVHTRVRNNRDTQYLIIGVNVENKVEEVREDLHSRFALSLDKKNFEELGIRRVSTENRSTLPQDMYLIYDVDRNSSLENGEIIFSDRNTDYRWSVSDMVNSAGFDNYIENPPDPIIKSVDVPESISPDQNEVSVKVTVSDDGDESLSLKEPLKLLISSTKISGSKVFTAPVNSGDTVTRTFKIRAYPDKGSNTETIRVNWGWDSVSKDIEINR